MSLSIDLHDLIPKSPGDPGADPYLCQLPQEAVVKLIDYLVKQPSFTPRDAMSLLGIALPHDKDECKSLENALEDLRELVKYKEAEKHLRSHPGCTWDECEDYARERCERYARRM
jgi:recombinational DNA repair protein RecR